MSRLDAAVAAGFVLAAIAEAVIRFHDTSGLMLFNGAGALGLASLGWRRRQPVLPACVIAAGGVVGSLLTAVFWPDAADSAGVWLFAMMLASYSLGRHSRGRTAALGVLLPLLVALASDLPTRNGWDLVSGITFVTGFVGLMPTGVGRIVRARHDRLKVLRDQQALISRQRRDEQQASVLAERLHTTQRLQPRLLNGLRTLADAADGDADPAAIETRARELLARTREEVLALTAPIEEPPTAAPVSVDYVARLRMSAQPWATVVGGALVTGLALESTHVLTLTTPGWVAMLASLAVGAPLALAWWRPVVAVGLAWVAATAYSRLIAPLDGSLSETGLAFVAAFAVAVLSRRRMAIVGLMVCWLGQLVGVGTSDPFGEAELLLMCWLGGLAVNEVSRLVEQTHANNEVIAEQEASAAHRAIVDERLRLARDLHDTLGHSLTVVALQAGAARRLADTDPGRAAEVMRTVAAAARDGVAALEPDDAMADIGGLVERIRATGLEIETEMAGGGALDVLDAPTRVAVYRLVQEALTNVLRHAPGSSVAVRLCRQGERFEVSIVNTAPTTAGGPPGSGRGLAGIRERVAGCGGEVSYAPRPDGGFEVRADLPVAAAVQRVSVPVTEAAGVAEAVR